MLFIIIVHSALQSKYNKLFIASCSLHTFVFLQTIIFFKYLFKERDIFVSI